MTKEQREELKRIDKTVRQTIKQTAKRQSCKVISICIYEKIDSYFACATFFVRFIDGKHILTLRTYIKLYIYDDIFWEVFDMKDNSNQSDSLRAIGAFTAPSIQLNERTYFISDINSIEAICCAAISDFKNDASDFIEKILLPYESFDLFVLEHPSEVNDVLLEIIANISLQRYANAESIAQAELNQGRVGRFQNRGIDINTYIVNYCKKQRLIYTIQTI